MNFMERLLLSSVVWHSREVIRADETKKEAIKLIACDGIKEVYRNVLQILDEQIVFFLALLILEKKCRMLCEAKTKVEIQEILKPSMPVHTYSGFREGPYHVPEEEMLIWSRLSLEAPLNQTGYKRYMELFSRYFPGEADEILKKISG